MLTITALQIRAQIRGIDLVHDESEVQVPFDIEQGFMVVELYLKGIYPLRLIFDTGAENTILFDQKPLEFLQIPVQQEVTLMGSDLDSVLTADISRGVKVRLEGCPIVKRDIISLKENMFDFGNLIGSTIDGILGASFFSNTVVSINYDKQIITIKNPNAFTPPKGKFRKYPLSIVSNKPYLKATVNVGGQPIEHLNLLLDTGAALPFLLHTNTDSTLHLPERLMTGNVGYGLSGVIYGYRGRTRRLQFGDLYFDQINTSFQDLPDLEEEKQKRILRNGILGNQLLSRFVVIIDYTKQELYLRPKRKYNMGFPYDKSGLAIFAVGADHSQYYVVGVIHDSPAYKAGVMPGDLIVKIGRRKAKKVSLNFITRKLANKTGTKIDLLVERDQALIPFTFYLSDWVNKATVLERGEG